MAQDDQVEKLLDTENLAEALGIDRFKQFLDNIPVAICVSEIRTPETIVYGNLSFEEVVGLGMPEMDGHPWSVLPGKRVGDGTPLFEAVVAAQEHIGVFEMPGDKMVDTWSNIISDDHGRPCFRLVAMVAAAEQDPSRADMEKLLQEKDMLLREIQHRVKNNLQMVTTLIRLESRSGSGKDTKGSFDRLAGRIESLALLYKSLSEADDQEVVDLGPYLGQIASAVMRAHAREGIHFDLQVDTWPVSIDVAMPVGLVLNELLTNSLKHAFPDGENGTIFLRCLVKRGACTVEIGDDGVGMDERVWPRAGKLSALIVRSLEQNAKAKVRVSSRPGQGTRTFISFAQADAA